MVFKIRDLTKAVKDKHVFAMIFLQKATD